MARGGLALSRRCKSCCRYFRALYHLGGVLAHSVGQVNSELRNQIVYAVLVLAGPGIGSRHGLGGVAAGVGLAIVYMFASMGGPG
jgi:hypothetical protein